MKEMIFQRLRLVLLTIVNQNRMDLLSWDYINVIYHF